MATMTSANREIVTLSYPFLDPLPDLDRDVAVALAHDAAEHRDRTAAQGHRRIREGVEHDLRAGLPGEHLAQRGGDLVEHAVDADVGVPELARQVVFPDRVAAELLAHEHLEQDLAHWLQSGVGQQ